MKHPEIPLPPLEQLVRKYEEDIYEVMRVNELVETQAKQWRLTRNGQYVGVISGGVK